MNALGLPFLVLLLAPAAARASEKPLLIVVETPPGLGVDGADVRQTIGAELGLPVLAPKDVTAGNPSDLMIVALDRGDIRMSLREGKAAPVSRTIPMPTERAARLQAIAWLAGNLARDQVSAIVAQAPAAVVPLAPATEPPPLRQTTEQTARPEVETLSARPAAPVVAYGPAPWSISVAAGATVTHDKDFFHPQAPGGGTRIGSTYQVELQHQLPGTFLFGGALEVGPSGDNYPRPHVLGAAAFFGSSWYGRRWFAEATAGIGLEAIRTSLTTRMVVEGSYGTADSTTVTTGQLQPALYGRGVGAIGMSFTRSLDLMARVELHVTSIGTPIVSTENRITDYATLAFGVRLRLP